MLRIMAIRALPLVMIRRPILQMAGDAIRDPLVIKVPIAPCVGSVTGRALIRIVIGWCIS